MEHAAPEKRWQLALAQSAAENGAHDKNTPRLSAK
jgi:hypothetical protein